MPEFSIGNRRVRLEHADVVSRLREVRAEPIEVHAVEVDGRLFPVVQALEAATGIPRGLTRSARARAVLADLGFRLVECRVGQRAARPSASSKPIATTRTQADEPIGRIAMNRLKEPRVPLRDVVAGKGGLSLDGFGLYAIYGDERTWAALGLAPFDSRPLYVGKAESGTLLTRDVSTHFRSGRTGSSTVRRSFAALLHDELGLRGQPRNLERPERFANYGLSAADDEKLTAWMVGSLELAAWLSPRDVSLRDVERVVLHAWLPAMNIADCPGPWRALVSAKRSVLADEARRWTPGH